MENEIKVGNKFTKFSRGMTVTSASAEIVQTYEVVEILEDQNFKCKLISDNTMMSVGNSNFKVFNIKEI